MLSFFFRELQLITVLLLICDSYMRWSTRFVSLKLCVGFSIFNSISFLSKFIFLFSKMHGLFDFNPFQAVGGLVGCVQSGELGARVTRVPRFTLLVSFSDTFVRLPFEAAFAVLKVLLIAHVGTMGLCQPPSRSNLAWG